MLLQELAHQAAGGSGAVIVLSLPGIAALLAGGVAWGKMDNRIRDLGDSVKALEETDYVCREEFNLLKDAIYAIRDDVRELRRRGP